MVSQERILAQIIGFKIISSSRWGSLLGVVTVVTEEPESGKVKINYRYCSEMNSGRK